MKKWFSAIILLVAVLIVGGALGSIYFAGRKNNPASSPRPDSPQQTEAERYVSTLSLREKVASLLVLHTPGADPHKLAGFVQKYRPAGVIFMGDNIPADESQLSKITAVIQNQSEKYPFFIATDQEGCSVRRIKTDRFGCAPELGEKPPTETFEAFRGRGKLLENYGINLNFGIVADVTGNPNSFIYPRVFGSNPQNVARRVQAAVNGTGDFTLSTLKHFPGHGETSADSHTSVPRTNAGKQRWQTRDKPPFLAGIAAGAEVVMMSHLTYASVDVEQPASLSEKWHTILRRDMHFNGLIITDDMIMLQYSGLKKYQQPAKNAIQALKAGNDALLFVTDHATKQSKINVDNLITGIVHAVRSGELSENVIDKHAVKVFRMRAAL